MMHVQPNIKFSSSLCLMVCFIDITHSCLGSSLDYAQSNRGKHEPYAHIDRISLSV